MAGIKESNKVKVFLSSNCDKPEDKEKGIIKYELMRKSLKLLLESTHVCEVYIFEEPLATSCDVGFSYMAPLDKSDLSIVIIDNKDGIGSGTQKEINRIAALNKKCIYIFCDEREKRPTELEKNLRKDISNPKYIVVHEFSQISEVVYKSVINDILFIYSSYCNGQLSTLELRESVGEKIDENVVSLASDSNVSKEFLKQFIYTKSIVRKELGLLNREENHSINIDKRCADLLGDIIGSSLTDKPVFDDIVQDIKKFHNKNIQKLVSIRYEAVKAYFKGELSKCVKKLNEAISFIDTCNNIPNWILNDVAIDLRNIQIQSDNEKNRINFHSDGQDILDKNKEMLYYPVLDRFLYNYNEKILNKQSRYDTKGFGGFDYGEINNVLDDITNAFLVACFYGSITHMLLTRKRICDFILNESLENRNHHLFLLAVRLLLLSEDDKKLEKYLNAYGENTNNINSTDVDNLLNSISKQPIKYRRIHARENVLRFFGYYYSDYSFERESKELVLEVKKSIESGYATNSLIKPLLYAMKDTVHRFDEETALAFSLFIFDKGNKRYYDDVFLFLYNFQFTKLSKKSQRIYQENLIKLLEDNDVRKNSHWIFPAAQTLRKYEIIGHSKLDRVVKKFNKKFFIDTYQLNIGQHDSDVAWEYTERLINDIKKDNISQGMNGSYTFSSYNPFLIILNILINDNLTYKSDQLKKILEITKETVFLENQTLETKERALELLCVVHLKHPKNNQIQNVFKEFVERREEILKTKEFFAYQGFGIININFIISMLGLILCQVDETEIAIKLVELQKSSDSEQMRALSFLDKIFRFDLSKKNPIIYDLFFQFLLNESYSKNSDIRFFSMCVMSKINIHKYRETYLDRFIDIMDDEDYKGKVGLLYRLSEDELKNPKVRYIFDKGKVDSHYWVRVAANRFNKND